MREFVGSAFRGEAVYNPFARRASVEKNQLNQSCSDLLGIAEGLLADGEHRDSEIQFLSRWLDNHGRSPANGRATYSMPGYERFSPTVLSPKPSATTW
jgi:hypothetical protein